jgi:hypothetical protein
MIAVMVGSLRAGLLPRWLSMLGILTGLLFLPFFSSSSLVPTLIPTFWLAATGFLLWERWPGGDPPAWAAGEARPWPSQAGLRAKRQEEKQGAPAGASPQRSKSTRNGGEPSADIAPAPIPAASSKRKRRKRS